MLLLAAGAVAAAVLRAKDQRADAKARNALAAAVIDVSAVGVATDHRVALVLSVRSDTSAKVVGASVDGLGWQAVHDKGVGLVTQVDCVTPPVAPSKAEAVLELHGQQRTFELLTTVDVGDVLARTGKEACGDVDARRALVLKASGTVRVPGGLQLALVVTNRSAHAVVLHDVSVGDLHVRTSKGLPVSLAPHATWRAVVVLDARGCGKPEPVVGIDISGQGGAAFVTVASADLPQLGLDIRKERCHR
ncbi:MAG: hypothetical protein JWO22_2584 [Frankiales bacterium]|nr:hypothetical protein [Frankiales bacterium]